MNGLMSLLGTDPPTPKPKPMYEVTVVNMCCWIYVKSRDVLIQSS